MEYRYLGRSGLRVSTITMGTMTFGGGGPFAATGTTQQAEASRLIDLCIDSGVNLLDTANVYSRGLSEEIIGNALGGKIVAGLDGSYLLEKKSRLLTSAPFGPSEVGVFTRSSDLGIRWKHNAFVTYATGNWAGTLRQQYTGGYAGYVPPGVANGNAVTPLWDPLVKPYTLYHASLAYSGVKNLTVTFGIKNLLDTDPPFANSYDTNTGSGSSWEPRVADPRGRSYLLMLDYKFF